MSQFTFVESVVHTWLELQPSLAGVLIASKVKRFPDGSKIAIEIQTQDRLALVEAWEHAMCLDTTIHQGGADSGTILAAGACEQRSEIKVRLLGLSNALLLKRQA
jgi:hypothetical protein